MRLGTGDAVGTELNSFTLSRVGNVGSKLFSLAAVLLLFTGGGAMACYAQGKSEPDFHSLAMPSATAEPPRLARASFAAGPAHAGFGTLKIFVPVGIVGDDYWIYLNGHLVSAPPHGTPEGLGHEFTQVQLHKGGITGPPNGWEIWGAQGRYLGMINESFYGLDEFLNSGRSAVQQLFQPAVLKLDAADYTVEVMMLSGQTHYRAGDGSFPFVLTRKYYITVSGSATAQIYVALPDNYVAGGVVPLAMTNLACPSDLAGSLKRPDLDRLYRTWEEIRTDPMVQALLRAQATQGSQPQDVVMLELPSSLGGPREFDHNQIGDIVNLVLFNHPLPTHSDVAECKDKAPQFRRSYETYDGEVTDIDQRLDAFRRLAD